MFWKLNFVLPAVDCKNKSIKTPVPRWAVNIKIKLLKLLSQEGGEGVLLKLRSQKRGEGVLLKLKA